MKEEDIIAFFRAYGGQPVATWPESAFAAFIRNNLGHTYVVLDQGKIVAAMIGRVETDNKGRWFRVNQIAQREPGHIPKLIASAAKRFRGEKLEGVKGMRRGRLRRLSWKTIIRILKYG